MVVLKKRVFGLALGSLGVVFGDIGTSPLYALKALFHVGSCLPIDQVTVWGCISLIIWSITIVVSIKYIGFIMRADNEGEGGIMALVSGIKEHASDWKQAWPFIVLGIIGVSLFYGDSTITPAISVLSAVEGLKVVAPNLDPMVVPITLLILLILFSIQRYGTGIIGKLFGPIMLIWFMAIGTAGAVQVVHYPAILHTLSPLVALGFLFQQPRLAFIAMGAVVLAITGAEALYADMGHFGRIPISRAWFWVVFPALLLCYMGQGALLLHNPNAISDPLFFLYPEAWRIPMIILATLATVIASQSVISGAFSLTRQAVQLNFLPKLLIQHTSLKEGGQIFLPFINSLLSLAVAILVLVFGSSIRLANAYGIAVSGTLAIDTILYLFLMGKILKRPVRSLVLAGIVFVAADFLFVTSTLPKITQGGWFPLMIAAAVCTVIITWVRGQAIASTERRELEGNLQHFIASLHRKHITRVSGVGVYISHHPGFAPLALHAMVDDLHELPEKVVVVAVDITNFAHVPEEKRAQFDNLGYNDGISFLRLTYGYHDSPNIPAALKALRHQYSGLNFNADTASYFISMSRVVLSERHNLMGWQKHLFSIMARNATSATDYYKLPIERTIEMQSLIKL